MTSKHRVQAALRRAPVDRVPVFMWFHPETSVRLADILEIPASLVAYVMGNDVRQTWVGNNYAMEGIVHALEGEGHTDDWGIEWTKVGPFNQIRRSPLQDADERQVSSHEYPHHRINALLSGMEPLVRDDPSAFIGCDISPCLFEMVSRLRGMEQAILDLVENPSIAEHCLDKAKHFAVELAREACTRYSLDWLWTGDDVAGQKSLIMSPGTWRSMIRPRLAEIVAVGKLHHLPVAYHCCGALRPIIPDLIEIGIDVLNPIQHGCPGMEAEELKREYGRSLSFMGGVDTLNLLPSGTPSQVLRSTERLIEVMTADGGGYILAASHTVPPETPVENIFALFRAAGITREEILDRAADTRGSARTDHS